AVRHLRRTGHRRGQGGLRPRVRAGVPPGLLRDEERAVRRPDLRGVRPEPPDGGRRLALRTTVAVRRSFGCFPGPRPNGVVAQPPGTADEPPRDFATVALPFGGRLGPGVAEQQG